MKRILIATVITLLNLLLTTTYGQSKAELSQCQIFDPETYTFETEKPGRVILMNRFINGFEKRIDYKDIAQEIIINKIKIDTFKSGNIELTLSFSLYLPDTILTLTYDKLKMVKTNKSNGDIFFKTIENERYNLYTFNLSFEEDFYGEKEFVKIEIEQRLNYDKSFKNSAVLNSEIYLEL